MNDPIERVERLTNAAYEIATRNRNRWIGPDHLLFVICTTEEGRREIEVRSGDYKAIYGFLSNSFKYRMEEDDELVPDFNSQFQLVVANPIMQARDGTISDIDIGLILKQIIDQHRICPITTAALIRGGLVEEGAEEVDDEDWELQNAMEAAAKGIIEHHEQKLKGDNEVGFSLNHNARAPNENVDEQSDPHLVAVMRAMKNLTDLAEKGALDPVIGRDDKISKAVDILQRRRKGNVLFVGAPGVGKTAIAEGVAQLLAMTDTPAAIADRPVIEVSIPDILAGTRYRGDFELRLRHMMSIARQKNAILFFDEAHMIVGAGGSGSGGAVDASNILKPAMARGEIQVMAATTSAEARTIRKDRALMRRFETVNVDEPDKETAIEILSGAEEAYSAHHGISYEENVSKACVEMAIKHIPDRQLPDKALDILDMAAVEAKNAGASIVSKEFVIEAVTALTGVNIGRPTSADIKIIRDFPEKMASRVFGQSEAMNILSSAVRISGTGLSQGGVAGSYLFNGPTGVGKTQAAQRMADALGIPLVRIDMSEYMESHSVSGLIGAPPGYVGYDDDGAIIAAAELHPRMVLLLDEIEKAHSNVHDILLQMLDHGCLTSSDGRSVNLRGVHVIMTANIGADEAEKASIGFGRNTDEEEVSMEAISKAFRKELLGRIRHTIQFKNLDRSAISEMVDSNLTEIMDDLAERGFGVEVDKSVTDMIVDRAMKTGATGRIVGEQMEKLIFDPVSLFVIDNEGVFGMRLDLKDDEIQVSAVFH
jgi:ATP-dependent Clp protease ATP-binding subunit ClpA